MLALRDPEEMMAHRRIAVSYEMIRYWTFMFGPTVATDLYRRKLSPVNRRGVTAPTGVLRD
jgi:transposase-like protein